MTTPICVPLSLVPVGTAFCYTAMPQEFPTIKEQHHTCALMVYLWCVDENCQPALNMPVAYLRHQTWRVTDFVGQRQPVVSWAFTGWSCTCSDPAPCIHVRAVALHLVYDKWWGVQMKWEKTPFKVALLFTHAAALLAEDPSPVSPLSVA